MQISDELRRAIEARKPLSKTVQGWDSLEEAYEYFPGFTTSEAAKALPMAGVGTLRMLVRKLGVEKREFRGQMIYCISDDDLARIRRRVMAVPRKRLVPIELTSEEWDAVTQAAREQGKTRPEIVGAQWRAALA